MVIVLVDAFEHSTSSGSFVSGRRRRIVHHGYHHHVPFFVAASRTNNNNKTTKYSSIVHFATSTRTNGSTIPSMDGSSSDENKNEIFQTFASFLQQKQSQIIEQLEQLDGEGNEFSNDRWGMFDTSTSTNSSSNSNNNEPPAQKKKRNAAGGITRVIQNGRIIEKGACSYTEIRHGTLSADRARAISGRQQQQGGQQEVKEGDMYSAAALSIVFHTRSPLVPTFRSDVRIFLVESSTSTSNDDDEDEKATRTSAWFGGGADLTPYYIFDEDHTDFHRTYRSLCDEHFDDNGKTYKVMKKACDDYFYLPARNEHRGTGGIFFDDMMATSKTLAFVQDVANTWMPSWLDTIVHKRQFMEYTHQQREWQLLRRGRYLEFNLLYDRGVKFGLANENPRVEGVMVSAPPLIRWEYNHKVEEGSEEAKLVDIVKHPRDWANL